MSSKNSVSKVVSVDEQAYEQVDTRAERDADAEYVVDETPEFRATVEMEIQAKVDANHPDGIVDTSEDRIYGATLAQEERIRAREKNSSASVPKPSWVSRTDEHDELGRRSSRCVVRSGSQSVE